MEPEGSEFEPLCQQASSHFESKRYAEAITVLEKLLLLRPNSPKLLHNLAVAKYYASQGVDPEALYEQVAALKGNSSSSSSSSSTPTDEELEDERPLNPLAAYNLAFICFRQRRIREATEILEEVFRGIEQVDEQVALKVLFLLLDVYLAQRLIERAAEVINFLEKTFGPYFPAKGENQGAENEETAPGSDHKAQSPEPPFVEELNEPNTSIEGGNFRMTMHLYKAKLCLVSRSVKPMKKEIKAAMNIDYRDPRVIVLKSHLEYLRQNYVKSLKLLNALRAVKDEDENTLNNEIYSNNFACLQHRYKKFSTAAYHFARAVEIDDRLRGQATTEHQDNLPEVIYNMGLQQLLAGRPEKAMLCLEQCASFYQDSALFWLRMGECCLAIERPKRQGQARFFGEGVAILPNPSPPSEPGAYLLKSVQYLEKALLLLSGAAPGNSSDLPFLSSEALFKKRLNEAILISLTYAHLQLGNFDPSLAYANMLHKEADCNRFIKQLAFLYAASVFLHQGKTKEAVKFLSKKFEAGEAEEDEKRERERLLLKDVYTDVSPSQIRDLFSVNLAVTHCLATELEKAEQQLTQTLSRLPASEDHRGNVATNSLLTFAFILIKRGQIPEAMALLKNGR